MAAPQNPSITAFNQLVDDIVELKGDHPDAQIERELRRGPDNMTNYLGIGQEVVIDGLRYLIRVNGWADRGRGSDYLQRSLHIGALSPVQISERRQVPVRYEIGWLTVFSGVREDIEALHEHAAMDFGPREALVAAFGDWAVKSVAAQNARRLMSHPDPHGRMRQEDHPTVENLEAIRAFAQTGEHVYTLSVPIDGWVSDSVLMVPFDRIAAGGEGATL